MQVEKENKHDWKQSFKCTTYLGSHIFKAAVSISIDA